MTLTDAELRMSSYPESWLADRAAVRALLKVLPTNLIVCDQADCIRVALRTDNDRDVYACDEHAQELGYEDFEDMAYAGAYRTLLARVRGWDGE